MSFALRYAARSDRGLIRNNNQDSVYAGPRLLAVADGMGGHAAGDLASKVVISTLAYLDEDRPHDDLIGSLRDATADANQHLRDLVAEDPNLDGMGTTLTAFLFAGNRIGVVHVGDSRAYLLRGGQLAQITHDDTFVQALVDEGRITEEEASTHPQRSLILRALNGAEVEPDLSIREARLGDRYLLCSDGLSGVVSADTLAEALQIPDPQQCADRMVELALRGGGPDNVTCIVADVIDVPYGDDTPVVDGAAGGNRGQREPAPTSAAARAALASPSHTKQQVPPEEGPIRRRRPIRTTIFTLIVLGLVAGGGYGLWEWTQTQYFVGADGDQVAIYRGINTAVGPVRLYSVVTPSALTLNDLQQVARQRVETGIAAESRPAADRILARLAESTLPPCPTATPTAKVTPTRSKAPSKAPGGAARSRTARPTPTRTTHPAPTTYAPTQTPTPTTTPVQGQDCK